MVVWRVSWGQLRLQPSKPEDLSVANIRSLLVDQDGLQNVILLPVPAELAVTLLESIPSVYPFPSLLFPNSLCSMLTAKARDRSDWEVCLCTENRMGEGLTVLVFR